MYFKRLSALLLALFMCLGTAFAGTEDTLQPAVKTTLWVELDEKQMAELLSTLEDATMEPALVQALASALNKLRLRVEGEGTNAAITLGSDAGDMQTIYYTIQEETASVLLETDLVPGYTISSQIGIASDMQQMESTVKEFQALGEHLSSADIQAWVQPYQEDISAYWNKNMAHSLSFEEGQYTMPDGSIWPVKGTFRMVEGEMAGLIKMVVERLDQDAAFKEYMDTLFDLLDAINQAAGNAEETPDMEEIFQELRATMAEAPVDSKSLLTTMEYYTNESHSDLFTTLKMENGQYMMLSLTGNQEDAKMSFTYLQVPDTGYSLGKTSGNTTNARLGSQAASPAPSESNDQETLIVQPTLQQMTDMYQSALHFGQEYQSMFRLEIAAKGPQQGPQDVDMLFQFFEPQAPVQDVRLNTRILSTAPLKVEGSVSSSMLAITPITSIHYAMEETAPTLPTLPTKGNELVVISSDGDMDEEEGMAIVEAFAQQGLTGLYQRIEKAFPMEAEVLNALLKTGIGEPLEDMLKQLKQAP